MRPKSLQLAIALVTTIVAGTVAWAILEARKHSDDSVTVIDNAEAVQRLLVERQQASAGASFKPTTNYADAVLVREPLDADRAPMLFTMPIPDFVYDPFTYYRYKGHYSAVETWDEYPGGEYVKSTSADGYREDFESLPPRGDVFIVATGDSHTDGLCENKLSFPNRLEAALVARHPKKSVEVLNTGVTGFSFYNYLGALEKFVDRKPDAFVVAFYGGNDFLDVVKPWHYFHHTAPPARRAGYWEKIDAARKVSNSSVAIAFNQLVYFQYYPDQIAIAIEAAAQVSAQIRRLCAQNGIKLVYVYIPPGFDYGGTLKPMFARAKQVLELSDYDLREYDHLADQLIAILEQMGIEVIDLRKHFSDGIDTYYWKDLHINLKGHQLIADLLLPRIEALVPIK